VIPPLVLKTKKDLLKNLSISNLMDHHKFVSEMTPSEIVKIVRFAMTYPQSNLPDLKKSILERLDEIGKNFHLYELIVLSRFVNRRSDTINSLIRDSISGDSLKKLSVPDLIYLIQVRSDLVASELGSRELTGYEVATVLNEFKKIPTSNLDSCLGRLTRKIKSLKLSPRDIALIANGVCERGDLNILDTISNMAKTRIDEFSPQGLVMLVHAFVKAGAHTQHADLVLKVCEIAKERIFDFRAPKTVGIFLFSLGKSELEIHSNLVTSFADLIKRDIQSYDWHTISCVCYGLSRLRFFSDSKLWQIIADEVVYRGTEKRFSKQTKRVTAQDVAMIAKAFSRLKNGSDDQLSHVLYKLLQKVECEDKSALIELLDSFTRIPSRGKTVSVWAQKSLSPIIAKLSPVELVSALRSVGKLGISSQRVHEELLQAAHRGISDPKLRIQAAMHLGKLGMYDASFFKKTGKIVSINLRSLDLDFLIYSLFAFSEVNHRDESLNSRLVFAIRNQLENRSDIEPRFLSTLWLACSRLRISDETLYELMMGKVFESIDKFDAERPIANTLFAVATSLGCEDYKDEAGWVRSVAPALLDKLPTKLSVEGIRQLQIFAITMKDRSEVLERVSGINTFDSNIPSIEQSSGAHREISKLLTRLNLDHRNEATIGPFSLDIFVQDANVIVEVDGPHHFFRDSVLRTSSSVLKHKLLTSMGYRLIHIPYHEWLQCDTESKKLAYCSDLVARIKTTEN
jgi:very-short-patch-repair endonuclease